MVGDLGVGQSGDRNFFRFDDREAIDIDAAMLAERRQKAQLIENLCSRRMKQLARKARLVAGTSFQHQNSPFAIGQGGRHCAAGDSTTDDDHVRIKASRRSLSPYPSPHPLAFVGAGLAAPVRGAWSGCGCAASHPFRPVVHRRTNGCAAAHCDAPGKARLNEKPVPRLLGAESKQSVCQPPTRRDPLLNPQHRASML